MSTSITNRSSRSNARIACPEANKKTNNKSAKSRKSIDPGELATVSFFNQKIDKDQSEAKFAQFYNGDLNRQEILKFKDEQLGYTCEKFLSFFMECDRREDEIFEGFSSLFAEDCKECNIEDEIFEGFSSLFAESYKECNEKLNLKEKIDLVFKKGQQNREEKIFCKDFLNTFSAEIENHLDTRITLFFLTLKSRKKDVWYQISEEGPAQAGRGTKLNGKHFIEAAHPFPIANLRYIEKGNPQDILKKAFESEFLRKSYSITTIFHWYLNNVDSYIEKRGCGNFENINRLALEKPEQSKGKGLKPFSLSVLNHEESPRIALEEIIQEMLDLLNSAKSHYDIDKNELKRKIEKRKSEHKNSKTFIKLEETLGKQKRILKEKEEEKKAFLEKSSKGFPRTKQNSINNINTRINNLEYKKSESLSRLDNKIKNEINKFKDKQEYLNKQIAKMEIRHLESLLTPEKKLKDSVWNSLEMYEHFQEIEDTEKDVE